MMRTPLALALLLSGCAATVAPPAPPPSVATAPAVGFGEWEKGFLDTLGALDPRFALRMTVKPGAEVIERVAAAAVIRGETNVGLVGGALDPFSYEVKTAELKALRARIAALPGQGRDGIRDEVTLLGRLLDAEELRVTLESHAPEAASERVRAIVSVWGEPRTKAAVDEREHLLARGLAAALEDVAQHRLVGPRALELEDALDPLEKLAIPDGYPEATKAITALRLDLGKGGAAPAPSSAAAVPLAAQLEAFVGVKEGRDRLLADLEQEEALLRLDAKARLKHVPEHSADEALRAAAAHIGKETRCMPGADTSPARFLAPPPERALVCDALETAQATYTPRDELVAAVVLHDDVCLALWALSLDGGVTNLDTARTKHPLLSSVPHPDQDRLVRSALVSPARAVAVGVAVVLLGVDGPGERSNRAARWIAYGDAPLDVVSGHLGR